MSEASYFKTGIAFTPIQEEFIERAFNGSTPDHNNQDKLPDVGAIV
jgi:hypothetical protein